MGKSLGELDWENLFPEKEKWIPKTRGPRWTGDDMKDMIRLIRLLNKSGTARGMTSYGRGNRGKLDMRQDCIVKVSRGGSLRSHIEHVFVYLPQNGKTGVSERPVLFGNCGGDEYRERMSERYFHIVISPGISMARDELESFTKSYMSRMSVEVGADIVWQAAVHTDTAHHHVHVIVNGTDSNGRRVRIPRDFIKRTGREISRDMLTIICGTRTHEEIASAEWNRLGSARWTRTDGEIKAAMVPDGRGGGCIASSDSVVSRRLEVLSGMGLAERSGNAWSVFPEWEETLKANGRYGVFLDARSEVPVGKKYKLYESDYGMITGTVARVYRMDGETVWTNAVVVDSGDVVYFVPTWNPPKVNEGQSIRISARSMQTGKLDVLVEPVSRGFRTERDGSGCGR